VINKNTTEVVCLDSDRKPDFEVYFKLVIIWKVKRLTIGLGSV